ncbi:hypothetical protein D3C81_212860 [compost metagenome]
MRTLNRLLLASLCSDLSTSSEACECGHQAHEVLHGQTQDTAFLIQDRRCTFSYYAQQRDQGNANRFWMGYHCLPDFC